MRFTTTSALLVALCAVTTVAADKKPAHEWPVYGGTTQNDHYSTLAQINREKRQSPPCDLDFRHRRIRRPADESHRG